MQVFWYLGVEAAIQRMFDNPEFCAARGTARDGPGYYTSKEAERVNVETAGALRKERASAYEGGIDWMQPYAAISWSCGVKTLRYTDMLLSWAWTTWSAAQAHRASS